MGWILEQGFRDLERGVERLGETVKRLIELRAFYDEDREDRGSTPSLSAPTAVKEDTSNNPACSLCGSRVDRMVFDKGRFFCFPCLERLKKRS